MKNAVNKTISLTQRVAKILKKQAKENYMSESAYIRHLILEKEVEINYTITNKNHE